MLCLAVLLPVLLSSADSQFADRPRVQDASALRSEARVLLRQVRQDVKELGPEQELRDSLAPILDWQLRAQDFGAVLLDVEYLGPADHSHVWKGYEVKSWRDHSPLDITWRNYEVLVPYTNAYGNHEMKRVDDPDHLDVAMPKRNRLYASMVTAGDLGALREAATEAMGLKDRRLRDASLSSVAQALAQLGDIDRATELSAAITVDESDVMNRTERAFAVVAIAEATVKGNKQAALRLVANINLDGLPLDAIAAVGVVQEEAGDRTSARSTFVRATTALPDQLVHSGDDYLLELHHLAASQKATGDQTGAIDTLRKALSLTFPNPKYENLGSEVGQLQFELGDREAATTTFTRLGETIASQDFSQPRFTADENRFNNLWGRDHELDVVTRYQLAVGDVRGAQETYRRIYVQLSEDQRLGSEFHKRDKEFYGGSLSAGVRRTATRQAQSGDEQGAFKRLRAAVQAKLASTDDDKASELRSLGQCQLTIGDTEGATLTLRALREQNTVGPMMELDQWKSDLTIGLIQTMLRKGECSAAHAIQDDPANIHLEPARVDWAYSTAFSIQLDYTQRVRVPSIALWPMFQWNPGRALDIVRSAPTDLSRISLYGLLADSSLAANDRSRALGCVKEALKLAATEPVSTSLIGPVAGLAPLVHRLGSKADSARSDLIKVAYKLVAGLPPDDQSGFQYSTDSSREFDGSHLLPGLVQALYDSGQVEEATKLSQRFGPKDLTWILRMQAGAGDGAGALQRIKPLSPTEKSKMTFEVAKGLVDRADRSDHDSLLWHSTNRSK